MTSSQESKLGFFARRKVRREARAHEHLVEESRKNYEKVLSTWQAQSWAAEEALEIAKAFNGESDYPGLLVKKDEAVFASVSNSALIEDRKGGGHWEGKSQGVSIPIGSIGGRSVRYRVGASRGHFISGTPAPTGLDTGTLIIPNQRLFFQGNRQTRECLFAKTLGYTSPPDNESIT